MHRIKVWGSKTQRGLRCLLDPKGLSLGLGKNPRQDLNLKKWHYSANTAPMDSKIEPNIREFIGLQHA
jgi:hypothetical protein